jgi:hypothetical protein
MKREFLLLAVLSCLPGWVHGAPSTALPEHPVPVTQAPANKGTPEQTLLSRPRSENQQIYASPGALVSADSASALSEKFRGAYGQAASPRIVIYVNRALVDTSSGLRLTGRTEKYFESKSTPKEGDPTVTSDKSGENTYTSGDAPKAPTLADQQTVREIERLFGRVFRNAGARLADQRAATALLESRPDVPLIGDQAVAERDALKQIADIAIEVLISSRSLTVTGVAGESTSTGPDIQTTAIRLSDSAILGQAASSDILGVGNSGGTIARRFTAQDITEATAFALMEDMLTGNR